MAAHKLIDSRFKQNRHGVVCKLDFERAYDMVDWDFLFYTMDRMGLVVCGVVGFSVVCLQQSFLFL